MFQHNVTRNCTKIWQDDAEDNREANWFLKILKFSNLTWQTDAILKIKKKLKLIFRHNSSGNHKEVWHENANHTVSFKI